MGSCVSKTKKRGRLVRRILPLVTVMVALAGVTPAQTGAESTATELKNPLAGNAQAVEEGRSQFRFNCAMCHGVNAQGTQKAPNLTTGRWAHGGSDGELFRTIQHGVPGTLMPAQESILTETETWQVISYLRSLQKPMPLAGDAERGKEVFIGDGSCMSCHMVDGHGGRLGPDLSRVGAERSTAYLAESIRQPSAHLAEGLTEPNKDLAQKYQTVTVITKEGKKITGVALDEDSFSLQMMSMDQKLHLFQKSDVREVVHGSKSLMPAYPPQMLSDRDLQDLVAYLASLRGQQ
jgi:putative heme-binding domain-containing protein